MAREKQEQMIAALVAVHDERTRALYKQYIAGATLEEAGASFGLGRERVRQILRDAGLPQRTLAETMAEKRTRELRANESAICLAYAVSRDIRQVAAQLDVPQTVVKEVVHARFGVRERRRKQVSPQRYLDDELLEYLREASAKLGGVLTTKQYSEYAKNRRTSDGRRWPTHQTHFKRFGSWRAALAAAGLAANPPSAIAGQRLFDEGHCLDAVRAVARTLGKVPTADEYDVAAKASRGALPSQATVRNRCGTWYAVLDRAGL